MKYIISSIWESPSWQWKNHSSIRCYLLLSFIYLSTVSSDSSDSCARWSGTGSGVDGSAGGGRGSVAPNESELFLASNTGKTWAKHDTMIHNAQNTINKKENEEKNGIGWCDFGHDQICGPFWYPFWGIPSLSLDWWVYHSIARPGGVIVGAHGLHVIHRAIEASCALSAMLLGCRTWKNISV